MELLDKLFIWWGFNLLVYFSVQHFHWLIYASEEKEDNYGSLCIWCHKEL